MSRVSLFSKFSNVQDIILRNADRLDETRRTIASGKEVRDPSDDPTAMVDIKRFSDQKEQIEQFKDNINSGETFLKNSESVVSQVTSVLQRSRQLAVQGSNDSLTDSDRENLADEVDQRVEQMVNLANSQIGGKYLFAGNETTAEQKPFQVRRNGEGEIVEVTYHGDRNDAEKQLGEGQRVASNLLGNEVFQATNQGITGGLRFENASDLLNPVEEATVTKPADQLPGPQDLETDAAAGANVTLDVRDASIFEVGQEVSVQDNAQTQATIAMSPQAPNPGPTSGDNTITLNNVGAFSVGDRIRISDNNGSERARVTGVNTGTNEITVNNPDAPAGQNLTNDYDETQNGQVELLGDPEGEHTVVKGVDRGANTITLDLKNSYQTGDDAQVRPLGREERPTGEGFFTVDDERFFYDFSEDSMVDIAERINNRGIRVEAKFVTEDGEEVAPGDVPTSQPRVARPPGYRFKLETRVPHQMYLQDIDRRPDATPNQVEGFLSDLKILGDESGNPPEPRDNQDFPNPLHGDAMVTGKSVFDSLIDLRESLQPRSDADSGEIELQSGGQGGAADTNRSLDPRTREGVDRSLEDLRRAIDNVVVNQSKVGARINRMESARTRMEDFDLNMSELLSEVQDANLAEVISDFERRRLVQQASLRVSSRIMNQSLVNFI